MVHLGGHRGGGPMRCSQMGGLDCRPKIFSMLKLDRGGGSLSIKRGLHHYAYPIANWGSILSPPAGKRKERDKVSRSKPMWGLAPYDIEMGAGVLDQRGLAPAL